MRQAAGSDLSSSVGPGRRHGLEPLECRLGLARPPSGLAAIGGGADGATWVGWSCQWRSPVTIPARAVRLAASIDQSSAFSASPNATSVNAEHREGEEKTRW